MQDDIERALEAHLQALASEPVIAWWGRPFVPVKGQPYLEATLTAQRVNSMALGAKAPELWEGFLQLTVLHPTAEGPAPARVRAKAVRDHFPRALTLTHGAAQLVVMERNAQPPQQAIDWLSYPILINWICEEIHT